MAPKRRNRVRPSMRPGRQVVPASLPAPFEWDSNLDDDDDDNNNGDDDDDDDDSSNEGEAEHDGRDNNTAQPSGSTTQDSDPVQKCGCSTTTTTTTRKRKRNVRDGAVGTDAGDDPPPRRRPVSAPDPRSGSRKSGENPHVEETEEEEQAPTTRTPVGPVWCVRCVEREACVWVPGMYAAGPAVSASILLCDTCVADKEVCHSVESAAWETLEKAVAASQALQPGGHIYNQERDAHAIVKGQANVAISQHRLATLFAPGSDYHRLCGPKTGPINGQFGKGPISEEEEKKKFKDEVVGEIRDEAASTRATVSACLSKTDALLGRVIRLAEITARDRERRAAIEEAWKNPSFCPD